MQLAPDDVEVLTVSATIAADRGDLARAEQEYRRALELRPGDALAACGYGMLLAHQGRPQEGLRYLEAAARVDPYSVDVLSSLGAALQDVGRPADALASLLRVIETEPGRVDEHTRIGVLFARSYGRLDLGLPWLERAASLDPGDVPTLRWLTALNWDLGRLEDARRWRHELQRRLGDLVDSSTIMAAGDEPGPTASALAQRVLDTDPHDETALAILAHADLAAQRPKQARRRYEQAFPQWVGATAPDLGADRLRAALDYAEMLRRTVEPARSAQIAAAAEQFLRELPRLSPNGYGLADVRAHAVRNDVGAALAALERAERDGWRGPCWRCSRDLDFVLDTIRHEPRFDAVFQRIERDLREQRRRLEARAPDEPLRTDPP